MLKGKLMAAAAAVLLGVVTQSHAATLAVGSSTTSLATGSSNLPAIGSVLAAQITNAPFVLRDSLNVVQETGTYNVWVYSPDSTTSATTIVFDFHVDTVTPSGDPLNPNIGVVRANVSNFAGFTTDVSEAGDVGSAIPTFVDRFSASTVAFTFGSGVGVGDTTDRFIIRTNANFYKLGSLQLSDAGVGTFLSFAPATAPLPDVAWMGMALMGVSAGTKGLKRLVKRA